MELDESVSTTRGDGGDPDWTDRGRPEECGRRGGVVTGGSDVG